MSRGDGAGPIPLPCPRDRADELAAVRSWIAARRDLRIEHVDVAPAEPVAGGRELARVLAAVRAAGAAPSGRPRRDRR